MTKIFDLSEATDEHSAIFEEVLKTSSFPWRHISRNVNILSRPMSAQFTGQWYVSGSRELGYPSRTMVLRDGMASGSIPFTIAHELGHVVDSLCLTRDLRDRLILLLHTNLPQRGHFNHDHPDAGHRSESWVSSDNSYVSKINEAFADVFVRAFCPIQWGDRYGRFVHDVEDLDAFRTLVLGDPMSTITDVPDNATHAEGIKWAVEQDLMKGFPDGTFRPNEPVTRGQLATILKRALSE